MMYLMCPRCKSYFEMDAESLGKRGRKVSCSVCHNTWQARHKHLSKRLPQEDDKNAGENANSPPPQHGQPGQLQPASPASHSTTDAFVPPPDSATHTQHYHRHTFAPLQFTERNLERQLNNLLRFAFSWALWGLCMLALVYGVLNYPLEIVQRFPKAVHFYERLNLEHPALAKLMLDGSDFSLTQAQVTSEFRLSRNLLAVRLLVGNRTNEEKPSPILRGIFLDARGQQTGYFQFTPLEETLGAKETLPYHVQIGLPQPTSTTLTLTLISPFEAQLQLGGNRLSVQNRAAQP